MAMLPVEYVLVAQRPETPGSPVERAEFGPFGAAFSAQTFGIYHPTALVAWVKFEVHMTAQTAEDAVRLKIRDEATGVSSYSDELVAPVMGLPRTVGQWLGPETWNARTNEHQYILEIKGKPLIYGAKVRVCYVVE